jgi:hypothetical protein
MRRNYCIRRDPHFGVPANHISLVARRRQRTQKDTAIGEILPKSGDSLILGKFPGETGDGT